MKSNLYECQKCKAKFEGLADTEKKLACPACGQKDVTVLEKKDSEESGCSGCAGCHGCH